MVSTQFQEEHLALTVRLSKIVLELINLMVLLEVDLSHHHRLHSLVHSAALTGRIVM